MLRYKTISQTLLMFVLSFCFLSLSKSDTKLAILTGDWHNAAVWSPAGVPVSGDSIVIKSDIGNPIIVTVTTSNIVIDALVIDGDGVGSSLEITNDRSLTVARSIENYSDFSTDGSISLGGNWINTGTFNAGGNTVTFNGSGTNQTIDNSDFNNLTINKTSGTVTLAGTINIIGNLTLTNGTLDLSSFTINRQSLGGTFTISNSATLKIGGTNTFPSNYQTVSLSTTSNVDYNGGATQTIARYSTSPNGAITYGNLNLYGTGTKTAADSITVAGNITIDVVTFSGQSNKTHKIAGNWTLSNGGTYNGQFTNNTVVFNGSGSQQISGGTFRNFSVAKSGGTLSLAGNVSVQSGNVNFSSGTIDLSTFTLDRTATGGTFTLSGTATISIDGTNTFPQNYTTVSLGTTTTVSFYGSSQTIPAYSYGHLSLSGSGTKTAGGNMSIAGNFSVSDVTFNGGTTITTFSGSSTLSGNGTLNYGDVSITSTLIDGGVSFNVSGSWTKSGTFTSTGTVTFNGGTAQTINASNFNNISFTGAGTKTLAGALTVTGNWSNSGTISTTQLLTFNGTGSQSIDNGSSSFASLTVNKSSGTATVITNDLTITGDFTISSGTFNDGGRNLNVAGSWTKSGGTFTATGTVTLNGSIQNISATNFNNLIVDGTDQKTATGNISIAGNLTANQNFVDASNTVTFNGASTFFNNGTLTFTNISVTGTLNDGGKTYTVNGNLANTGTLTSTGTVIFGGTTSVSGTSTFNNLTVNGTVTLATSASVLISGAITNNGTFDATTNNSTTVTYNGTGAQSVLSIPYNTLSFSGSGTKTASGDSVVIKSGISVANGVTFDGGTGKIVIDGTVTFSGSGTFNLNSLQINSTRNLSLGSTSINLSGNLVNNGTLTPESSTVTMSGASKTVGGNSNASFNHFVVSGSVTTANSVTLSGNFSVTGSFSASSGTTTFSGTSTLTGTANLFNVTISSNRTLTLTTNAVLGISSTFTINSNANLDAESNTPNTVVYNGTTQNVVSETYDNLTLSGGTKTASNAITVNRVFTIENSTTFNDNGKSISYLGNISNDGIYSGSTNGSANFIGASTLSGSGTYNFNTVSIDNTLTSGSINFGVAGNWTNTGTFSTTGVVTINGSGNQTINTSNFYSLVISGSSTKTFSGTYAITGDFTVNAGPTFTSTSSNFTFSGSALQTLTGGTFNDIALDNASGISLGGSSNVTINGTVTLTSGDITTNSNSITLGASAVLSETAGNVIIGTVTTQRTLSTSSSYTFGGIGLDIATSNTAPGVTTVSRKTGEAQSGGGSFAGNSSILRYFDITPTTNSNLNATVTFHYDENELDGQSEVTLSLWKSTNSGTNWSGVAGSVNVNNNTVSQSNQSSLGRYTVADANNPMQPNSVTVRTYRDTDGKSSTTSDWVSKTWHIRLYKDSELGTLVGEIESDTVLVIDTLSSGTYYALISDSSGWRHLSRRADGANPESSSVGSKTVSISGGTSHSIDFSNFHPNILNVRNYLDSDGLYATSNDRTAKKWNLIIYKGSVSPTNIQSQVTSDSVLIDNNLADGTYIVVEADSSGYAHVGYTSTDLSEETQNSQVSLQLTNGETKNVNFINRVNLNTITIRKYLDTDNNFATSGPDRIAKSWHLTVYNNAGTKIGEADTTELVVTGITSGTYYAVESDTLGWRKMGYLYSLDDDTVFNAESSSDSIPITFSGGGHNAIINFVNSNADSAFFLTFTQSLSYSKGWGSGGGKVPKILKKAPTKAKALVKPSIANLLDTVFYKTYSKVSPNVNGLYLGVAGAVLNSSNKPRTDTVAFVFSKDAKGFRLFVDHSFAARGFDGNNKPEDWNAVKNNVKKATKFKGYIKAKKPQNGTNNVLAGELAALRMNIAMSDTAKISSQGLRDIIFDMKNGATNPLNNKTLSQICTAVDTALTFWQKFYNDTSYKHGTTYSRYETGHPLYDTLYQSLKRINLAFNDDVDSNDFVVDSSGAFPWYSTINLKKGVGKPLYLSPFLKSNSKASYHSVNMIKDNLLPNNFVMYQNYPNPFNPVTTLEFYLPTDAIVTLKVYNILGQEIQTIFNNEELEEGFEEVDFDASHLSSGIYFYRLSATPLDKSDGFGDYSVTKKLTLIK
ncbi:MAG: T9SS type A sorting domain-containing protein [Bacteroidota bacterium]